MEWQCRNWLYFSWLSGDHIVEQHVHNIDVVNWAMGAMPKNVMGMGGRQVRVAPEYGNIFDHFAVEFEYPNGVRATSMCRQTKGCADRVEERIVGTKGVALEHAAKITGEKPWTFEAKEINPVRAGAHRPDRVDPQGQAAQRGAAGRREHDVRDHRAG